MGGRKDCNLWCCSSSKVILGTSFEATHWRSLDPCGLAGVSCSLGVHLFAFATIALYLIEASLLSTTLFVLLYVPVSLLAMTSLYMAFVTNPGAVPMGARPLVTVKRASSGELEPAQSRQRALRRCHKCNDNFKPNRAHHDSVTGRCIVKFDHFCPWVGNAVGALNHKFFVLFVGYTMCSCILSLFLLFIRAMHCGWVTDDSSDSAASSYSFSTAAISGNSHSNDYNNELGGEGEEEGGGDQYTDGTRFLELHYREECHGFYNSYATLILLIVSVVFMIFTCCMLMEQIEAIETNSSKIARMKMRVGQAGTELARVTEEFNEMFGGNSNKVAWHWFLPTEVEFPRGMQKVVLGYDWDETFDPVPYEEGNGGLHTNSNTNNNYDYNNTNGVSTGRGFDEELGSSIELTSTASKTILLSESGNGLNHIPRSTSSDGEEGSLLGTSVSNGRHTHLTQRSNSRGPETRLKEAPGTLT